MTDMEIKAWQTECLAIDLISKMEKRGFEAFYAPTAEAAKKTVLDLLPAEGEVAMVGSQTMNQIGVYAHLRESDRDLIDPATQTQGLSEREVHLYRCRIFTAAVLLTGTNAMDREGRLYNIDGIGNRVAPMIFGPDKVIVAVGMNKLSATSQEAWRRVRQVAGPMNNKRLSIPNPCLKTGQCHDCQHPGSICNYFTVIDRSRPQGRIQVVLIGEDTGY